MVSANLQMAMQGLVVIPLFAGYDLRLKKGRIFTYDVTGGRFEETDFHATGSGGRDAKNTVKLSYRERLGRDEAVELAVAALYEAADEDTATGWSGPAPGDLSRGRDRRRRGLPSPRGHRGRRALRQTSSSAAASGAREARPDDDALLRGARAGHEGPRRVRPEGDRQRARACRDHL